MTPDKRLNQLEPVMAEFSAQLDQHSALHKQTQAQIRQLGNAVAQQSDDIVFLLNGQADHTRRLERIEQQQVEMKAEITGIKAEITGMKTEITGIKAGITGIKSELAEIRTEQAKQGETLNAILNILQGRSNN